MVMPSKLAKNKIKFDTTMKIKKNTYKPKIDKNMTIVIDTREQRPYDFKDADTERKTVSFGDYTVEGFSPQMEKLISISIERKELSDFYSSIGGDRDRFFRELDNMRNFVTFRGLVIEATEQEIMQCSDTKLTPNSLYGTILCMEVKYGMHIYMSSRANCELKTLSWLSYFYNAHK